MPLISTIKAILGMGDSEESEDGTTVTVEREANEQSGTSVGDITEEAAPAVEEPASEVEADEEEAVEEPEDDAEPAEEADTEPGEETDVGTDDEPVGDETESAGEPVDSISGIGPAYAERLADAGIETVDDLAGADAAEVADATDIAESRVADWIERAGSN